MFQLTALSAHQPSKGVHCVTENYVDNRETHPFGGLPDMSPYGTMSFLFSSRCLTGE